MGLSVSITLRFSIGTKVQTPKQNGTFHLKSITCEIRKLSGIRTCEYLNDASNDFAICTHTDILHSKQFCHYFAIV